MWLKGVILSRKVGWTIHRFYIVQCKNSCISPFFTKFLPDHAKSKLGLTKENLIRVKL